MRNVMASAPPDIDLLDVNVWLALSDESHVHHGPARRYWSETSASQFAFTRVTMLGLVRLLTNRAAMNNQPFTVSEAWEVYRAFRALPEVIWIGELESDARAVDARLETWLAEPQFTTRLWTDAHLASIAVTFGCRLVSFDGGFQTFEHLNFLHLTA
jgi:uncharacterized protein